MTERENQAVFDRRCDEMRRVIDRVRADMVSTALAGMLLEPVEDWSDRIYDRLEDMHPRDLALMVVLLMHVDATEEANRLWSGLWTTKPEEIR